MADPVVDPAMRRTAIEAAVEAVGLVPRGWTAVTAADALPAFGDGRRVASLLLVGWVGRRGWPAFAAAPEYRDRQADPLDRWSARLIGGLADALDGVALFPFGGPPWWPFQRWALRTGPLAVSPLGLLIDPEVGLWHAFRGALGFADEPAPSAPSAPVASPCATCAGRPCLTTCPVDAFSEAGYDVERCVAHIESPLGALCRTDGCRARDACPVGRGRRYSDEQIRFLMRAFRKARSAARPTR